MLWCVLTLSRSTPHSTFDLPPLPEPLTAADWQTLACWAGRYTPRISLALEGPLPALYFEVSGSVSLFGGRDALLADVRISLAQWPWALALGVAVSARGALWLALASITTVAADLETLRTALRTVPLTVLPLPAKEAQRLTGFGLRRLGEVMDLPRAALATRLGQGFVLNLARALGEVDEPLRWLVFPEEFIQSLELPAPIEVAPVLLFACRHLLMALVGWLTARNAAVSSLLWRFEHARGGPVPTLLPLNFSAPVHAPERIERVLSEALGRLLLPAPVLNVALEVRDPVVRDARSHALFPGGTASVEGDAAGAFAELIDRLHARLGDGTVVGLQCHADHRPERASREVGAGETAVNGLAARSAAAAPSTSAVPLIPDRPLCLLNAAQLLRERNGRPWLDGPLRLLAGPERIESGWWDGADVTRDYFVALDAQERWCWIYRSGGESARWYLHGLFV